jgi:hypothetical protein
LRLGLDVHPLPPFVGLLSQSISRLFLAAPTQGTKPFSASAESLRVFTGAGNASRGMTRVTLVLVLVVLLAVAGGCLFLATWHLNVPRVAVEKVLPDARFPR